MTKTNYYTWAFRFTIWILIINIVVFFSIVKFNPAQYDEGQFLKTLEYFGLLSVVLFVLAIIFLIIGFVKKEAQKYQFWIALLLCFGYLFFILLGQVNSYIIM